MKQRRNFNFLQKDLHLFDSEYFFRKSRMAPSTIEILLSWIGPFIVKSGLRRPTATPAKRLCVTLRYLASGDSQLTIASSYRISPSTVSRIVTETTQVISDVLVKEGFLEAPSSMEEWTNIANDVELYWNFPNCLRAIGGKHVNIQAPACSDSMYYNYKTFQYNFICCL